LFFNNDTKSTQTILLLIFAIKQLICCNFRLNYREY